MSSKRGWALENVVARICREAGGRVTTNVFMRDLDLGQPDVVDGRRLEVIVDGVVLQSTRRRKERTYSELLGGRARSKLVVLAV